MSFSLPLDVESMRVLVASLEVAIKSMREDEEKVLAEFNAAKKKFQDWSDGLKQNQEWVIAINQQLAQINKDAQENPPSDASPEVAFNSPEQLTKSRRRKGVDDVTWDIFTADDSPKSADELVRLVNTQFPDISPKSVKNALGEFVKKQLVVKYYSKAQRIWLYTANESKKSKDLFNDSEGTATMADDTLIGESQQKETAPVEAGAESE